MIRTTLMLALVFGLSASLSAQKGAAVGTKAKPFTVTKCVNEPDAKTLEDCIGDVVLIKFWGVN